MKTSIKRVICAVFAFCMIVCALSACGGNNGGDTASGTASANKGNSGKGDSSATGDIAVPDRIESKDGYGEDYNPYASIPDSIKGSTVRFATWIDHYTTEGAEPLGKFEKDTGLKAELVYVPSGKYVDTLQTKIAAGDIPDVFVSNESAECFPRTIEIAQPINKCSTVDLEDPIWDQSMLATATIDGNVYMVNTLNTPWSGSNLVYFNKELFENNGFKTPAEYYEEGNWTWATLEKVLKDIKSLGNDYKGGMVNVGIIADTMGASFVKYDYKTTTYSSGVNDPNLVAAYEWYANIKEQGLADATTTDFVNGKCGIVITGVYGLKATGHWQNMDPESVGFTYLPALKDGTKGRVSSINRMYGIIAGAPNANAAGYFLRHFLDYKNYDLSNTFLTKEAGDFYYELTNTVADQKYFNFDSTTSTFVGTGSFSTNVIKAPAAQVKTQIQAVSNLTDAAASRANDIIAKVRAAYK